MINKITKTFTITTSTEVMRRFERFLALLHLNSHWGHSATFAMPLDGDGPDRFEVADLDFSLVKKDVNLIGNVGHEVEVAYNDSYGTVAKKRDAKRYTAKDGILYRDGEQIK